MSCPWTTLDGKHGTFPFRATHCHTHLLRRRVPRDGRFYPAVASAIHCHIKRSQRGAPSRPFGAKVCATAHHWSGAHQLATPVWLGMDTLAHGPGLRFMCLLRLQNCGWKSSTCHASRHLTSPVVSVHCHRAGLRVVRLHVRICGGCRDSLVGWPGDRSIRWHTPCSTPRAQIAHIGWTRLRPDLRQHPCPSFRRHCNLVSGARGLSAGCGGTLDRRRRGRSPV